MMKKMPFKWLYVFSLVAVVVLGVAVAQENKKDNAETEEIVVEEVAKEESPAKEGKEEVAVEEKTTEAEPKEDEVAQDESSDEDAAQEPTPDDMQPGEETEEAVVVEEKEEVQEAPADEMEAEKPAEQKEKPEEEKAPESTPEKVELGPDEIMGIDTVDLEDPQGNWLYKRVWWERAEAKYEKIRASVISVMEVRTKFFAKRADLEKKILDPFYIKIGLSQGELQAQLSELIAKLERELQDKKDVQLLEKLEADKQELEQLKQEVQEVVKQDEAVENAILMLVEQANKMRNYEQQAWQNFKNIARVLDDKKARELFYKVDGAWRNIQELQKYVENNFSSGFDTLIENVSNKVQQVDNSMQALKAKGLDLKKLVTEEDETQDEDEEEEQPPQGLIARYLINPITLFVKAIWDGITWPIRKIMGITDVAQKEEGVQEEVMKEKGEPTEESVSSETQAVAPSIPAPPDIATPTPAIEPDVQDTQKAKAIGDDTTDEEIVEVDVKPVADEDATNEVFAESEGDDDASGDAQIEETIDVEESETPISDELDMDLEEIEQE